MSVGAKSGFHNQLKELLFNYLSMPYLGTWDDEYEVELKDDYNQKIAAIILEPLVQGASGMRICRPQFIKAVIDLAQQSDILVIFDEIMTGFCRTGAYFAREQLAIIPDFLCLSKGLQVDSYPWP